MLIFFVRSCSRKSFFNAFANFPRFRHSVSSFGYDQFKSTPSKISSYCSYKKLDTDFTNSFRIAFVLVAFAKPFVREDPPIVTCISHSNRFLAFFSLSRFNADGNLSSFSNCPFSSTSMEKRRIASVRAHKAFTMLSEVVSFAIRQSGRYPSTLIGFFFFVGEESPFANALCAKTTKTTKKKREERTLEDASKKLLFSKRE